MFYDSFMTMEINVMINYPLDSITSFTRQVAIWSNCVTNVSKVHWVTGKYDENQLGKQFVWTIFNGHLQSSSPAFC